MGAEDTHDSGAESKGSSQMSGCSAYVSPQLQAQINRSIGIIKGSVLSSVKTPNLSLNASLFRDMSSTAKIIESQQKIFTSILKTKPDSLALINGAGIKMPQGALSALKLNQDFLGLYTESILNNVNLGISDTVSRAVAQFASIQADWLKHLAPTLTRLKRSFYPENLQPIDGLRFESVQEVVMSDGIPLYGVPRTSIAQSLLKADGRGKRREILGRRWRSISEDCRVAIDSCQSSATKTFRDSARAALDALDAGHHQAAQALAGSVIDAILNMYFGDKRSKYTPHPSGKRTTAAYEEFGSRQFIAFAPIWTTYQQFHVAQGDSVPTTFSRNATAHTVSPRQYSRRNAIQGLMVACSLILRVHEENGAIQG
ncbi:hypothetical protein [Microbacterium sp. YY-01]|uniref:hypothetical protein n=1 Tax=Microbacterium sp. YY-01 TaxID=3421634 RepID=UPI003D17F1C0